MPYLKNAFFLAAFICFLIINSFAQTNEAGIFITVKDQFDGSVPDAEITLGKTDEKEKQTKTNNLGIAQFSKLSAGEYRIIVTAAGFKEYAVTDIIVNNNQTQKIEVVLEVAAIESNVEIGEDEAVEAEKTGATTILSERQIANLPDNQEELERAIKRLGEAVTGEELPISVNGVQGGKIPPKQQIQQIRVNQNVFSAQYDSPFGGGIEIFTRSNVDKFRGYVSFSFADSRFNAADPFLGKRV
ncbi:MAG: carboxypeptidase-like regulatory domain-containing protein, partial [Acidobacteriota bacterium]|nr:carboxypeptidase-like regulatory domain-containing protein [Acidobacteriota bacterium]